MFRNLKVVAVSAFIVSASIAGVQAAPNNDVNYKDNVQAVSQDNSISKRDAKNIVKDYLKSKNVGKKYKVGKIKKKGDNWIISVTSNRVPVLTTYVDAKTGEITTKK